MAGGGVQCPRHPGEEGEVRLTIVKPKKQKTPVAVGAGEGGGSDGEHELAEGEGDEDSVIAPDEPADEA